mgnify:CR=1 FL=1
MKSYLDGPSDHSRNSCGRRRRRLRARFASEQAGGSGREGRHGGRGRSRSGGKRALGGNPFAGAATGAAIGAASGAAAGGVSGSMADSAAKDKAAKPAETDAKLAELRQRDRRQELCDRACCWRSARIGTQSRQRRRPWRRRRTPRSEMYAMFIESVAAGGVGRQGLWQLPSIRRWCRRMAAGEASKTARRYFEGVMKVQAARREYGLPPICG